MLIVKPSVMTFAFLRVLFIALVLLVLTSHVQAQHRKYYGGGHHIASHGGHYSGARGGSSHKGGCSQNVRSYHRYGIHSTQQKTRRR
jgi:hypothetical protein